jgi:hypothetical protein
MCVTGIDQDGEPRILELSSRRLFVARLFVPQAFSKPNSPHPLIIDFVSAAGAHWLKDVLSLLLSSGNFNQAGNRLDAKSVSSHGLGFTSRT